MSENNDVMLGKVLGQLEAQHTMLQEVLTRQRGMDEWMRQAERRISVNGATAGGVAGVAVAVTVATVKAKLGL